MDNLGIVALKTFGASLMEKLIKQNPNFGGRLALITGPQGTGKTSLLIHFAMLLYKDEIVIWRERIPPQFHKIPDWQNITKLYFHESTEPEFYLIDLKTNKPTKIGLEYEYYKDIDDLLGKLKKGYINVVFGPLEYRLSDEMLGVLENQYGLKITKKDLKEMKASYFWFEVFYKLIHRIDREWISVIIDEVDDLFPENPAGFQWKLQNWLKDMIKDFRKARISLFASTHNANNVDYRIRSKFQFFIYLKGAEPLENSMVRKELILRLGFGQAIIEWGNFGIFTFQPVPQPDYDIMIKLNKRKIQLKEIKVEKYHISKYIMYVAKFEGIERAIEVLEHLLKTNQISYDHYKRLRRKLSKML